MPDRKTITSPEKAINIEVPRSGCNKIMIVGKSTINREITIERFCTGSVPLEIYLAIIRGMAIFINSEGWNVIPRSSQRVALFRVSPIIKTSVRSNTQKKYNQGAILL